MTFDQMKRDIDRYIRQVHRKLPLPKEKRGQVTDTLNGYIHDFIECHPDAVFQDVIDDLGTPQKYADVQRPDFSPEDLAKGRRERRRFYIAMHIIGFILIVVMFVVGLFIYQLLKNREFQIVDRASYGSSYVTDINVDASSTFDTNDGI